MYPFVLLALNTTLDSLMYACKLVLSGLYSFLNFSFEMSLKDLLWIVKSACNFLLLIFPSLKAENSLFSSTASFDSKDSTK